MYYVVWDRENNGVRLTQKPSGEQLNVCPRPVFYEELDFLGMDKRGWTYPRCKEPLLWACERRYFYKGELVLETKGGNMFDLPETIIHNNVLKLSSIDIEKLCDTNYNVMFKIEHDAMDFINNVFTRYRNNNGNGNNKTIDFEVLKSNIESKTKKEFAIVKEECDSFDIIPLSKVEEMGKMPIYNTKIEMFIASFSGGKDSQVLLDLVARTIPSSDYYVVYSDTGYELPTSLILYDDIKTFYQNEYPDMKFVIAKNHQSVLYYWDEMDAPSKLHRWCCSVMKTAPLYRLLKTINGTGKQPNVVAFEGVRAEESEKRSRYSKIGRGVKHNKVINARPLFDWNTTEIWLYILLHNLPFNIAYRKGLSRVGCVVCPLSSELGDCLDYNFFKDKATPFVNKLRNNSIKAGIPNVDDYIKLRKWKVRAGGNRFETTSLVEINSTNPDFEAKLINPKENLFQWMKTLGQFQKEDDNSIQRYNIRYGHDVIEVIVEDMASDLKMKVQNSFKNPQFISHLKKVINKATYCVHCEVCEIECPTGALSVVPRVHIDEKKCIHCQKCLDFKENGCVTASSIKKTSINKKNMNNTLVKTPIRRYNTFGFREMWFDYYIKNYETYFDNSDHGLNVKKQIPPFVTWLRDAGIINQDNKEISEEGICISNLYQSSPLTAWELLWINLSMNSELIFWYINAIEFGRTYPRKEIDVLFEIEFSKETVNVRDNALKALQNTFVTSPLGNKLKEGCVTKEGGKPFITRMQYNDLSLLATAYSLYRYAEKNNRYDLTVSELYNIEQKEGIYRQFGIERDVFESNLRSLEMDHNHVLRAELKMGLDNIILRKDLTSLDVLKMLV